MARSAAQINTTLAKVRTAIDAILDGGALKSYSLGGRSYSLHSIGELWELERQLEDELAEVSGQSSVVLASFKLERGP